jgi:hypothetical protein
MIARLQRLSGKRRTGVVVFDGTRWIGRVFALKNGEWMADVPTEAISPNGRQIPESILNALIDGDATAVRLLLPTESRVGTVAGADDLEPEELHTALAYELAAEWGRAPEQMRLAIVPAIELGLGLAADQFVVAGFDQSMIAGFARVFHQAGIRFEGVNGIELALLRQQTRTGETFLFLRSQSSFLASSATERQPATLQEVPVGLQEEGTESGRERLLRLQRRLQVNAGHPLRIVAAGEQGEETQNRIQHLVGISSPAVVGYFDDVLPALMQAALREAVCTPALPPPRPRDPNRVGTWLCLGVIVLTGLLLFTHWHMLRRQIQREEGRQAAWADLQQERASYEKRFNQMREERDALYEVERIFNQPDRVPAALPVLLEALADGMPIQTRITRIRQTGPDAFELAGKTRWPNGKIHLHRLLSDTFFPLGMIVEPGTLQFHEDALEQEFIYLLTPAGGRQ